VPESNASSHASEAGMRAPRERLVAGRYRLLRELGRGGMGTVWLAEDQLVIRQVAIKELRPPSGLADADRDTFTQRALREARSAARVHHANAVALYDVLPATAADDAVYLIMELIEGPTLSKLIERNGPLPDATVAAYGLQLLAVLEAAHALGVVHRDIKPGNILTTPDGQAKLADFGIAQNVGDTRLTRGGMMGTQAYMAPELFNSQPITPTADLWSLGVTLYHAAEGRGPFDRDTTGATLRAILLDDIPAPHCSPGLAAAISGMLQRDPQQRATIEQARTFLREAAAQTPEPRAKPTADPRPAWDQAITARSPSATPPQRVPAPHATQDRHPGRRAPGRHGAGAALMARVTGGAFAARLGAGTSITLSSRSRMLNPGKGDADTIAFSPNGTMLATSDTNGAAIVWDIADGSVIASLPYGTDVADMAFSPDGRTLAIADSLGSVELWDVADRASATSLAATGAQGVAFSPDGSILAVAAFQGVQLWHIPSRQWITALSGIGGSGPLSAVAFSPDGRTLAAGIASTGEVYVWNFTDRGLIAALPPPSTDGSHGLGGIAFSHDCGALAIGTPTDGVRLWDVASRTWDTYLTDPHDQDVSAVAFSPIGRILAVGDVTGIVSLWDTAVRELTAVQHVSDRGVDDVAFSHDGKMLATSDFSGYIYLWDVAGLG